MKNLILILLISFNALCYSQSTITAEDIIEVIITSDDSTGLQNNPPFKIKMGGLLCFDPENNPMELSMIKSWPIDNVFFIENKTVFIMSDDLLLYVVVEKLFNWGFTYCATDGQFETCGDVSVHFKYKPSTSISISNVNP